MITFETPKDEEDIKKTLGKELWEFDILTMEKHQKDPIKNDEPYCAKEEIRMDFSNGLEMRIYIDEDGNLCIYTD